MMPSSRVSLTLSSRTEPTTAERGGLPWPGQGETAEKRGRVEVRNSSLAHNLPSGLELTSVTSLENAWVR